MKGAEIITEYLVRERVPYVVGLCGHGNLGLLDALYDRTAPVTRMVLRDAQRRPGRLLLSSASIALATAIVVAGSVLTDSMGEALRLQFEVSHREPVTVTLDRPHAWRAPES